MRASQPPAREETTGVYDMSFFQAKEAKETLALDHLAAAKAGLSMFCTEAGQALKLDGLTVDQRIHVATILSFIEGLSKRLDIVRQPGFVHPKRPKVRRATPAGPRYAQRKR